MARKTKLDEAKVLELRSKGNSIDDIAKLQGVAKSTVHRFLESLDMDYDRLEKYKAGRADVLVELQRVSAHMRLAILKTFKVDELEKMTFAERRELYKALAISQAVDLDKERLLTGQSTANIQSLLVTVQRDLDAERRGLKPSDDSGQ